VIRPAGSIGAGLAAARDPRPIRAGERIHVVGAAGAGASAAALHAYWQGAVVSACDVGGPSPYTSALEEAGISLAIGHDPAHVTTSPTPGRLAVTKALTAIDPDNAELAAARDAGIPIEPWQQVIADAAVGRRLVAIAGTHGKSTTAGWLVAALRARAPLAFVGALLPGIRSGPPSTAVGNTAGDLFVVEADEYAGNFDPYRPSISVLTSVEWDHPDVFADELAVRDAFDAWIRRSVWHEGHRPVLVANVGDRGARLVAEQLSGWDGGVFATQLIDEETSPETAIAEARERFRTRAGPGEAIVGVVRAMDADGTTLEVFGLPEAFDPLVVRLPTAGRHNAANALTVIGVASLLGEKPRMIARNVAAFAGVGRRLERKGEARGVIVYDDYGHHPTAIRATIEAVRQRQPGDRIWAVYEPLTFHRTAAMLDGFAEALSEADAVAIADIWAGRDPDTTVTSAASLATAVASRRPDMTVAAPGSVDATADWLAEAVRPGDVVLVMGGGRSYRIGERLLELLDGA
jgi:UDP-N-acetylmuramate--alanine ligase